MDELKELFVVLPHILSRSMEQACL